MNDYEEAVIKASDTNLGLSIFAKQISEAFIYANLGDGAFILHLISGSDLVAYSPPGFFEKQLIPMGVSLSFKYTQPRFFEIIVSTGFLKMSVFVTFCRTFILLRGLNSIESVNNRFRLVPKYLQHWAVRR